MYDRHWTVRFANGSGPLALSLPDLTLPDNTNEFWLEAWVGTALDNSGGTQGPNVLLFVDSPPTAEIVSLLADAAHLVDCLMVIPGGMVGKVRLPPDTPRRLTVYQDGASGAPQYVTVRIYEL